jgi:tRNA 2-thiouridine synthesizing protein A
MNWVRARLALEGMARGQVLELQLDRGEPLQSVPRSAEEDGHSVEVDGTTVRIVKA